MKKILFVALMATCFSTITATAQKDPVDKSKRPSPPAKATETLKNGTVVSIDYSQPSVKGRTIGKDLEPKVKNVWRMGANEATIFEVSKDVTIEGKTLPAGKYSLFSLVEGNEWTIIFNKTWNQWGAFNYKESDDALRVKVTSVKAPKFAETLTFAISSAGKVTLLWGDTQVGFQVK